MSKLDDVNKLVKDLATPWPITLLNHIPEAAYDEAAKLSIKIEKDIKDAAERILDSGGEMGGEYRESARGLGRALQSYRRVYNMLKHPFRELLRRHQWLRLNPFTKPPETYPTINTIDELPILAPKDGNQNSGTDMVDLIDQFMDDSATGGRNSAAILDQIIQPALAVIEKDTTLERTAMNMRGVPKDPEEFVLGWMSFRKRPETIVVRSGYDVQEDEPTLRGEGLAHSLTSEATTISVDLTFTKDEVEKGMLLDFVAMLRCSPILPLSNQYLNNTFDISAVMVDSWAINTATGFPGTLEVRISLLKFDFRRHIPHSNYFPAIYNFGFVKKHAWAEWKERLRGKNAKLIDQKNAMRFTYKTSSDMNLENEASDRKQVQLSGDFKRIIRRAQEFYQFMLSSADDRDIKATAIGNKAKFVATKTIHYEISDEWRLIKRITHKAAKKKISFLEWYDKVWDIMLIIWRLEVHLGKGFDPKELYVDIESDNMKKYVEADVLKYNSLLTMKPYPSTATDLENVDKKRQDKIGSINKQLWQKRESFFKHDTNGILKTILTPGLLRYAISYEKHLRNHKGEKYLDKFDKTKKSGEFDFDTALSATSITGISVSQSNNIARVPISGAKNIMLQYLGSGSHTVTIEYETTSETDVSRIEAFIHLMDRLKKSYSKHVVGGMLNIENMILNHAGVEEAFVADHTVMRQEGVTDLIIGTITLRGIRVPKKSELLTEIITTNAGDEAREALLTRRINPYKDFVLGKTKNAALKAKRKGGEPLDLDFFILPEWLDVKIDLPNVDSAPMAMQVGEKVLHSHFKYDSEGRPYVMLDGITPGSREYIDLSSMPSYPALYELDKRTKPISYMRMMEKFKDVEIELEKLIADAAANAKLGGETVEKYSSYDPKVSKTTTYGAANLMINSLQRADQAINAGVVTKKGMTFLKHTKERIEELGSKVTFRQAFPGAYFFAIEEDEAESVEEKVSGGRFFSSIAQALNRIPAIETDGKSWVHQELGNVMAKKSKFINFDDFYGYARVYNYTINQSRRFSSDVATVTIDDSWGLLSMQQAETKNTSHSNTALEQNLEGINVNVGTKIQIRMGYSLDVARMECKFNGRIAEMSKDSNRITAMAYSHATQLEVGVQDLISKYPRGFKNFMSKMNFNSTETVWEAIINKMMSRHGKMTNSFMEAGAAYNIQPQPMLCWFMDDLGNIIFGTEENKTPIKKLILSDNQVFRDFGPSHIVKIRRPASTWENSFDPNAGFVMEKAEKRNKYLTMRTMNINPIWTTRRYKLFSKEENMTYSIQNKTVWQVFNEMRQMNPNYVARVLPSGTGSTIYFGPKDGYYIAELPEVQGIDKAKFAKHYQLSKKEIADTTIPMAIDVFNKKEKKYNTEFKDMTVESVANETTNGESLFESKIYASLELSGEEFGPSVRLAWQGAQDDLAVERADLAREVISAYAEYNTMTYPPRSKDKKGNMVLTDSYQRLMDRVEEACRTYNAVAEPYIMTSGYLSEDGKTSERIPYRKWTAKDIIKPFRKQNIAISKKNLVSNDITASAQGTYNRIIGSVRDNGLSAFRNYMSEGFKDIIWKFPGHLNNILKNANHMSHGNVFMPTGWEYFFHDAKTSWMRTDTGNIELGDFKADDDLHEEGTRTLVAELEDWSNGSISDDAKDFTKEKNRCISMLADSLKDTYKGTITILASPEINIYDELYINDPENDLFGVVEVEEVTHSFSGQGCVTTIIPDMVVYANDSFKFVGMWDAVTKAYTISNYAERNLGDDVPETQDRLHSWTLDVISDNPIKDGVFFSPDRGAKDIAKYGKTATNVADIILDNITKVYTWLVPKHLRDRILKQPIQVLPLIRPIEGKFLVAGLDGARGIDPFSHDEIRWYENALKFFDLFQDKSTRRFLYEDEGLSGK